MAEDTGDHVTDDDGAQGTDKNVALDYDTWLAKQDDATKNMVTGRFHNLESAHGRVKEERNTLREDLASIKKDKSLDADGKVEAISAKLDAAEKKNIFLETLPQGINPKNAFLLAQGNDCLEKDGSLDVDKLKEACPELFTTPKKVVTNAGNVGDVDGGVNQSMNTNLRLLAIR